MNPYDLLIQQDLLVVHASVIMVMPEKPLLIPAHLLDLIKISGQDVRLIGSVRYPLLRTGRAAMRKDKIHLPIIPDQIAEPLRQFILRRHLFLPPAYMVDPVQFLLLIQLLPLLPKPWISSLQDPS